MELSEVIVVDVGIIFFQQRVSGKCAAFKQLSPKRGIAIYLPKVGVSDQSQFKRDCISFPSMVLTTLGTTSIPMLLRMRG